jgi:hypothetical protein
LLSHIIINIFCDLLLEFCVLVPSNSHECFHYACGGILSKCFNLPPYMNLSKIIVKRWLLTWLTLVTCFDSDSTGGTALER